MQHPRCLLVVVLVIAGVTVLVAGGVPKQEQEPDLLAQVFSAYSKGDFGVLGRSLTTSRAVRAAERDLKGMLRRWRNHREPVQAVFLLDFAFAGLKLGGGLDVLDQALAFISTRPDPPGRNAPEDEFEIAWWKAALPMLERLRDATILQERGINPLRRRMKSSGQTGAGARLVDPWFALTCGIAEEQWMGQQPLRLREHGEAAAKLFAEATTSGSTRAEALVRLAWVLVRLGRHEEALSALDEFGDHATDTTLRYWSRLFRARALERLGRLADAARVYGEALALVPHAQSPAVALALIETRRGHGGDADRWATAGRAANGASDDPWWQYGDGEFRFYEARMSALRGEIRR